MFSWIIESRGIQAWSFCNRVLCASGIQLDVGANRLVGAPSGRRNDSKQCRRHFPSVDILSCIHSLGIVFGDCSIFCGGCPWIWNGCIES